MMLWLGALLAIQPVPASPRGLASTITIDPMGSPVVAKPITADEQPRVVVRVEPADASGRQRVEFVGLVAGEHDLRDFLMRADGGAASSLAPIMVRIESRLSADHATDVLGLAEPNLMFGRGYVAALAGLATAWALVPVAAYVRRRLNRPVAAPLPPPAPEPSLAEQLLAMLESWDSPGSAGDHSDGRGLERRAALELLALRHQRATVAERDEAIAAAMVRARRDDRTREVVLALEAWLHAKASDPAAAQETALSQLRAIATRDATTGGGGAS